MPHTNRAEIEIARPPEDVFPWLVDADKRLRWVEGLESSEQVGERRYREVFASQGMRAEADVEVRTLEPPHTVAIHLSAKAFEADSRSEALANGDGSRVVSTIETTYKGFMAKAAAPMITRQTQVSLERSLAKLKELVEASSP